MRIALLLLVACASDPPRTWCPKGEQCSPVVDPAGLYFAAPTIHAYEPAPFPKLAVGGTMDADLEIQLLTDNGPMFKPLDVPYTATATRPVTLVPHESSLTISAPATLGDRFGGSGSATIDVRDKDGLLLGRDELLITTVTDVFLTIGLDPEQYRSAEDGHVFAPGSPVSIGLTDASSSPVIDERMQIVGAPRLTWDQFEAPATSGKVTVIAGDHAPVELAVPVATTVTLARIDGTPAVAVAMPATVCFEARSEGHQVYGLTWSFTVTGVGGTNVGGDPSRYGKNCIEVSAEPLGTATSAMITVTAGGASLTVMLPVI